MVSYEHMSLQMVPMELLPGWEMFSRRQLNDLAGNMYVACQFMAAQLCAFCLVPPSCEPEFIGNDDEAVDTLVASALACLPK